MGLAEPRRLNVVGISEQAVKCVTETASSLCFRKILKYKGLSLLPFPNSVQNIIIAVATKDLKGALNVIHHSVQKNGCCEGSSAT